jgi:hypothetical protein
VGGEQSSRHKGSLLLSERLSFFAQDPGVLAAFTHEPTGRYYWMDPKTGESTWEVGLCSGR